MKDKNGQTTLTFGEIKVLGWGVGGICCILGTEWRSKEAKGESGMRWVRGTSRGQVLPVLAGHDKIWVSTYQQK